MKNLEFSFKPTSTSLFFSKNDPNDPRLGDLAHAFDAQNELIFANDYCIVGYPDDEGIKLNGGRPGSHEAPKLIRQFLYKMTPALHHQRTFRLCDFGDISLEIPLSERHEVARRSAKLFHQHQAKVISLGGGHDYGYSDACGFIDNSANTTHKPVVINFDAHLDVRPNLHGNNSGTPFYRMLTEFHEQVHFIEIGLQPQCNSQNHYNWAQAHGAHLYDLRWIENKGMMSLFNEKIFRELHPESPLFISFDIDALTASEAGGCSQAWATGLRLSECLRFLSTLYKRTKACGLGIYEVSPPLDRDFQTSKTAALLAHHFIFES